MILYIENPNDSSRKLLELISEYWPVVFFFGVASLSGFGIMVMVAS